MLCGAQNLFMQHNLQVPEALGNDIMNDLMKLESIDVTDIGSEISA